MQPQGGRLGDRRPPAGRVAPGGASDGCRLTGSLLHHSDRGVQYASDAYQSPLAEHGIEPSVSRVGNCWDNAVMESFFSSLKYEEVYLKSYQDVMEMEVGLGGWFTFYNQERPHQALGFRTPAEVYRGATPVGP